jgi:nitrate reductase cytochrome c-type subunit
VRHHKSGTLLGVLEVLFTTAAAATASAQTTTTAAATTAATTTTTTASLTATEKSKVEKSHLNEPPQVGKELSR